MSISQSIAALLLLFLWPAVASYAAPTEAGFVHMLEQGKRQTIVVYGTSLTANSAWPGELQDTLRSFFGKKARVINAAKGGMDSRWGIANLEQRVIREQPDAVTIEFAINDALTSSKLSVHESQRNLEDMIRMIRQRWPSCEILLMVMNPPTGSQLEKRQHIRDYEAVYRSVAKRKACRLVDFTVVWSPIIAKQPSRWQSYVPDEIHPTNKACREVIAPYLFKEIGLTRSLDGKVQSSR